MDLQLDDALGLLDDDKEYVDGIVEAMNWGSAHYLRNLFATLLLSNSLTRPKFVWEQSLRHLSDDILYRQHSLLHHQGRKAHSRFAIPLGPNEDSTCNIKHGSLHAELIVKTNLSFRIKSDLDIDLIGDIHTPKFLNAIKCSGVPNHELKLKIGIPIMLLRNVDHSSGLCNGTRLVITRLGNHVLEGKVVLGSNVGFKVLISRMTLTPLHPRLPFKFQRRQYPLVVSYAMTINKS
ncbi:hypothetical protein FEM48_Zijuj08G0191000 [Ziziphus jujuba var. spinosa]|uniref:ATP-dependent DNA helicase n=1 Tax=Ziziphus jujuba var. spinosa TaxID=714518 RepID=A0A978V0U8_ZIZJJ|nr:hypothetical protein FEM48_Zijuj08G0191000 [Ziziphus jujuba var. spinosa]